MARPRKQTEAVPPPAPQANGEQISKMEGVRRALSELGNDAKPLEIQKYLKKTFNIDMQTTVISSYKTSIQTKAKKGPGKKRGRKPGTVAAVVTVTAPVSAISQGRSRGGISLEDIRAVKELADRLGAEKVWQLAEVLAR